MSDELTLSTQVCLLHWKMNPSRRFTICFIRVGFRRNNCHSRVSGELKMSWNKEKRDNLQSCCFASRAFRPGNFAPHFRTRGTLYLKPACFGLWLKEREISHIKRAWFALWLIGRGILHLKRVKWLENRGRNDRLPLTDRCFARLFWRSRCRGCESSPILFHKRYLCIYLWSHKLVLSVTHLTPSLCVFAICR